MLIKPILRKKVAIKILFPQEVLAGNARLFAKKLFFNEAQTLAQLTHTHSIQVFDYDEEEEHGWSYFVMEYAPFGSLADRYAPGERLPLSTVEAYTSQMGRAIHYIHMRGLIHRDIKPQNIFLETRSSVVLGDFGLVMRNHGRHYPWMKMEFEEACRAVKKGVSPKTSRNNLSVMPAINREGTGARLTYVLRHQRSVGLVSQSELAEQGDVLVATYPVARSYWQSDEDFWDPPFTSVGGGIGLALTSQWQNFWGRFRSVWERIAQFLLESL